MSWRRVSCCAALLASISCAEPAPQEPPAPHPCGGSTERTRAVMRTLRFVGESGGVTRGLDLDGAVSGQADAQGCFKEDLRDEAGREGIDNQFSRLLPAIELAGGEGGLDAVVRRAIQEGAILLVLDLARVDDAAEDACVELHMWRGIGRPSVGADGELLSGQTLDVEPEVGSSHVLDARLDGGVYTAGPVDIDVPFELSGFTLKLSVRRATLEFVRGEDGRWTGLIAGALVVDELLGVIDTIATAGEDSLTRLLRRAITQNADMSPDAAGRCAELSISLEFEAVPAFIYEDVALPY